MLPRKFTSPHGLVVLVGRNAVMNEHITFELARHDDYWFHATAEAGAHVLMLKGPGDASVEDMLYAATLAAKYSNTKNSTTNVAVTAARGIDLSRPRKRVVGMVVVSNVTTFNVNLIKK